MRKLTVNQVQRSDRGIHQMIGYLHTHDLTADYVAAYRAGVKARRNRRLRPRR